MNTYLKHIRVYIYILTFILTVAVFSIFHTISRITQSFALLSCIYLYITLLATPLCRISSVARTKGMYLHGRRAFGVSAFYFALLHAGFAFFGQLGGFSGIGFLPPNYLLAVVISSLALLILTVMAATSFDTVEKKLGHAKWKLIHRFVYIAGILILIHALMLGTHFANLSDRIPQISMAALSLLFILEAKRFDDFLESRYSAVPLFGITMTMVISILATLSILQSIPQVGTVSLGIHSEHIQRARDAQSGDVSQANVVLPGLSGDTTRRYTVSFLHSDEGTPNTKTQLTFQVFDAATGQSINLYSRIYEKPLHLIIVDSELTYFSHIHPDQIENGFTIQTTFPRSGIYHLYLDFQPLGAVEQQFAFTLPVGDAKAVFSTTQPDTGFNKVFSPYRVTLHFPSPLSATKLSVGNQKLVFTFTDEKTGKPVTTLRPYLAAFGHLVMINRDTFDYLHVHPTTVIAADSTASGGPDVEFQPLGLYGPVKPGIYRIFGEFNPDGHLLVADFTVSIEK